MKHSRLENVLSWTLFSVVALVICPTASRAQVIAPQFSQQLTVTNIGSDIFRGANAHSRITQMAITDGPSENQKYLYMASNVAGIRRVTYDVSNFGLVTGSLTPIATDITGLGIAFDGKTLYASQFYESDVPSVPTVELSRLWRIDDLGMGKRTAIVQGIPRQDHGVDHIQIKDHQLFVGIGVRTRNGAFQTFSDDTYGESAYGGSIGVIDDLRQVGPDDNAAGFYPAHPNRNQFEKLINGQDPIAASPFTTTDPGKLRVHSNGTRNPFGVAADGDGNVWFTNNSQRVENHIYNRDNLTTTEGDEFGGDGFQDDMHDQLFKIQPNADYGYRNGNWQSGNVAGNPQAVDAGFFAPENRVASFTFDNFVDPVAANERDAQNPALNQNYSLTNPVGLGPSSSANGFDFYTGNALPLAFHQDAFVARWNGAISDGGDSLTYRDVVSVDLNTGNVERIASNFRNPLDVVDDGYGNLLVADWDGSIFRISATQPATTAHAFSWDSDQNGNWSDRLSWNAASLADDDRLVPHEWGTARYAVVIDRPNANPVVTLDRDARVESVRVADTLRLNPETTLTVDERLTVLPTGTLVGAGRVVGSLENQGVVDVTAQVQVDHFLQTGNGKLRLRSAGANLQDAPLNVFESVELGGLVELDLADISQYPRGQDTGVGMIEATRFTGAQQFRLLVNGTETNLLQRTHVGNGLFAQPDFLSVADGRSLLAMFVYAATAGDANGDSVFGSSDLVQVFQRGEYEDDIPGNSDWTEGDWDGDVDFGTSDLVAAFQTGTYSSAAENVPEPSAWLAISIAMLSWPVFRRSASRRRRR